MNTLSMTIIDVFVLSVILWLFFISGACFWAVFRDRQHKIKYIYIPDPGEVVKQPCTVVHMDRPELPDNVLFFNNTNQEVD